MGENEYAQQILHAYCGEVRGEATFAQMARDETDASARHIWLKVAEVEARTRACVEPLARRLHDDLGDAVERARAEGLERAQARKPLTWRQIAESYVPQLPEFVARFEALETIAPAEDRPALAQLSEHSRAFGACIKTWLAGDADGAAAHLQHYLDASHAGGF